MIQFQNQASNRAKYLIQNQDKSQSKDINGVAFLNA